MKYRNLLILLFILNISCNEGNEVEKTAPEPTKDNSPVIKVMSYNIHIGNPPSKDAGYRDLPAIAQVINLQKPDLVALSEVDNKTRRSGLTVNQAKELGRLTGMYYYFTKAMNYQDGEYGDAVLSRFPILDSIRHELPTTGSSFEPRSAAMILVEKEGRKFYFTATHLDHTSGDANRILQASRLIEILKTLSLPILLAGDLNATPNSEPIQILKQELQIGCNNNCPYTFSALNPTRTIDYIMCRPASFFKFLNYKVVNETYASDHLPLIAEIELE